MLVKSKNVRRFVRVRKNVRNMINVKFYLDKADKSKKYPIHLVLRQKELQIKVATGEKVMKKDWDNKNQSVKGIDGRGIAKINGILSFHIIFQCKRYKGKVSSKEIRDFRGAMVGRTDKGLFITTGDFTRDAFLEATRDGVQTIDLIDGEKLAEKLKELNLGVKIEHREIVTVDEDWFNRFD